MAGAIEAGIDLVQVREPDVPAGLLCEIVREAVRASRGSVTRIVVNDRVDVALAAGADGVHLGGRSLPADRVREISPPGFLIGRSIHTRDEAASAGDRVDYLIAGTVFRSASKPGESRLLGPDGLAALVRVARLPVLAIGGVDLATIPAVARAGAAGFAAIGLFSDAFANGALADVVQRARDTFDTAGVIP